MDLADADLAQLLLLVVALDLGSGDVFLGFVEEVVVFLLKLGAGLTVLSDSAQRSDQLSLFIQNSLIISD